MLIRCGMLSRLPFGIPSRSIGQLLGNRTFVGHVVPQFLVLLAGLKSLRFVMLDVSSQNPSITEISSRGREVLEFILLKHGGLCLRAPLSALSMTFVPLAYGAIFLLFAPGRHSMYAYVLSGKATTLLRPWAWRVWVDVVSCDFGFLSLQASFDDSF
ncbi:hypothetical protein HID58_087274 [Brassica napus]|uniref:Uncharacterized protein n=1 Tax=Brassica napus TaxID=3708 RepID=A0ABQ7XSV1_BRANA|nr:hypothetical protein HID58_087274 [Brassica napus]